LPSDTSVQFTITDINPKWLQIVADNISKNAYGLGLTNWSLI
jgi:hypothetical protein